MVGQAVLHKDNGRKWMQREGVGGAVDMYHHWNVDGIGVGPDSTVIAIEKYARTVAVGFGVGAHVHHHPPSR